MPVSTIKNYRWIIVTLLFLATTINYVDRQIIGLLKPILEVEFHWTVAKTDVIAAARIASDTTRGLLPAGFWTFPVSANDGDMIYVRSTGAVSTGGLSYFLVEGD